MAFSRSKGMLIYALCEPEDRYGTSGRFYKKREIRYVGLSSTGTKRPMAHFNKYNQSRYSHLPLYKWINLLNKRGMRPEIVVLECEFTDKEALKLAEQRYIAHFRFFGLNLTNLSDGGDGPLGVKRSPETLEKLRLSHLGKGKWDEDRRENVRKIMKGNSYGKGYKLTPEQLINHSKASKNRVWKDTSRVKVSESQPNRKMVVDDSGTIYRSVSLAAKENNVSREGVSKSIRNGKPLWKINKTFRYLNE